MQLLMQANLKYSFNNALPGIYGSLFNTGNGSIPVLPLPFAHIEMPVKSAKLHIIK